MGLIEKLTKKISKQLDIQKMKNLNFSSFCARYQYVLGKVINPSQEGSSSVSMHYLERIAAHLFSTMLTTLSSQLISIQRRQIDFLDSTREARN